MRSFVAWLVALFVVFAPHASRACGGLADIGHLRVGQQLYVAPTEDEVAASLPFMSTEQVLVIFDPSTNVEHLVLELRFDKASDSSKRESPLLGDSFGLLVPVPSAPSAIEKVAQSPFNSLRDVYVFTPENLFSLGGGIGLRNNLAYQGSGAGGGRNGASEHEPAPPPVEVLDEHPIGSLTSFTLAVHDASELGPWLSAHDFAAPKAIDAWADRYARMGFSFVALKVSHDADAGTGVTSETIRISFATPEPFFPYSEPVASKVTKRLLSAWVIAPSASRPIARDADAIAQPWKSGQRATASHDELALVLKDLASVIPIGDKLVVQTFRDWKTTREGWGDVIFVPEKIATFDGVAKEQRKKLLGVIDSDLVPPRVMAIASAMPSAAPSSSAPSPIASSAPSAPASRGCSASGADASTSAIVFVIAFLLRRKRLASFAVLAACAKSPAPVAQDAAAIASASASSSASASVADESPAPSSSFDPARVTAAFAILAGDLQDGGARVIAGSAPIPPPPNPTGDVKLVNVTAQGPLDVAIARRVIQRTLPQLRYCYASALLAEPNLSGNITAQIVVTPNGDVSNANASGSSGNVQSCMSMRFRNTQFPRPTALTILTVRLSLRPPDR